MIISKDNPKIKNIIKLRKAKERALQGLVVVEGEKEIGMAFSSGLELVEQYFCNDFGKKIVPSIDASMEVSREVFQKMSVRENPDGQIAIFKIANSGIKRLKLSDKPFLIICEGIEKPGNLGAILRTADAVGADAVILNNSQVDIYNHNVIRNSRGTVFSVPIFEMSIIDTIQYLKENKIRSIATTPNAKNIYSNIYFKEGVAILVGAEHDGLSDEWLESADEKVRIPMQGKIDSLNASVSTAILAYEVLRQRA